MISHTAKLYCYACNINFDDDAITYSQHMQITHNVTMTKDLISRAKANLQKSESQQLQQQQMNDIRKSKDEIQAPFQDMEENDLQQSHQQKVMEVFKVQSSSVSNGQIPKLKITIKKEPIHEGSEKDGNESDSSSSSSNSSDSTSSSSSSSSSSSATSNSNNEKIDNN